MFSTPDSTKISDEFVSVHILGGNDLDEEGRAFMERYGVQGYPTLLAVTAGGALVDGDLMKGQFRDAAFLLEGMRQAKTANDAFLAERDALAGKTDPESMATLAALLEKRRDFAAARALYEKILTASEAPEVETYGRLLNILRVQADQETEQELLSTLMERFPDHEDRMDWRVRQATMHIPPPTSQADMDAFLEGYGTALEGVRKESEAAGDKDGEAAIRVHLAAVAADGGDEDGFEAHVNWVFENAPDSSGAREAKLLLLRRAASRRDEDAAKEHANWIIEHGPESRQAAEAHMVLGDLAYGEGDNDAMFAHFQEVVRLSPESRMGKIAADVLKGLAEQAAAEASSEVPPAEGD